MQSIAQHVVTSMLRTYPGQILGFRADGRPIRTIAGGSSPAGGEGGAGDGGQNGGGAGDGGQGGSGDGGAGAGQGGTGGSGDSGSGSGDGKDGGTSNVWDDPAKAKAEIEKLRTENAKDRTSAKEKAAADERAKILKALGLAEDGKEIPDPDKLAQQLASRDAEMANMRRERAAEKAARTHSGDVDALMDSRAFVTSLGDLDPEATDFATKVDALVKKTITDNPKFKTQAQAAGQSGGEFSGGSGEHGKTRPTSLHAAIAASRTSS